MCIISILAEESIEKIRRIEGAIEKESSILVNSISNSNSNFMACNYNSGIGIEVKSNSGIYPTLPSIKICYDWIWLPQWQ